MTPELLAKIKANLIADEGCTNWLYLDTRGNPTCGVGHKVPTFAAANDLPFEPKLTYTEWEKLVTTPKALRASAYQIDTLARLSDASLDALLDADIAVRAEALRVEFPALDAWPDGAVVATFNMLYNLGMGGLLKFTHWTCAARAGDWATCAAQCVREGVSAARNAATAALFAEGASA